MNHKNGMTRMARMTHIALTLVGCAAVAATIAGCEKKNATPDAPTSTGTAPAIAPAATAPAATPAGAPTAAPSAPTTPASSSSAAPAGPAPSFSLAWSEYPSWSVFGVASDQGLIDGAKGKLGSIERKYNVDIELRQADYDACLQMYGAAAVDAACITNMDALNPALSRPSVLILPTSTSNGGDAMIAVGVTDIKQLKKPRAVYGLSKSVSEYAFVRGLQKLGEDPANYEFRNMDPGAAAQAMQTKQSNIEAIMVWNPFVLQTLKMRADAKVIFDSSLIPGEIIDAVVMSRDSLGKPGGEAFAKAVAEAFYEVCKMMADPKTADSTFVALGSKFSSLDAAAMRIVCTQTEFYSTPDKGLALVNGAAMKSTMTTVVEFCVTNDIVPKAPSIVFGSYKDAGALKADLVIDPSFMEAVKSGNASGSNQK